MKQIIKEKNTLFNTFKIGKRKILFLICLIFFIVKTCVYLIKAIFFSIIAYWIIQNEVPQRLLLSGKIRSYIHKIIFFVHPLFQIVFRKPTQIKQFRTLILAGIATPIFDDLYDKYQLNNHILSFIPQIKNNNEILSIFFQLLSAIENKVSDKRMFQKHYNKVIIAQNESLKQTQNISLPEILKITELKGGNALRLYATCYDIQLNGIEERLIFKLGDVFQIIDDIYDIEHDETNNIRTLAVYYKHKLLSLKLLLARKIKEIYELKDGLPKVNSKNFNYFIQLLSFIAAFQIKKNELKQKKLSILTLNIYYALNFSCFIKLKIKYHVDQHREQLI